MSVSSWVNVIYVSASLLTGIAATVTKLKDFVNRKQGDILNEVLFYGSDDEERKKQVGLKNLICINYVILHASQTVDVCVPTLNSETLSKCFINVHSKNHAKVRIIVHNSNVLKKSQEFLDCGIEVKFIKSEVKLEHEFLLIDSNSQDAVAIIGALDYEVNRVNCNRDNTLLTSDVTLVLSLKREFDRVWGSNNAVNLRQSEEIEKS